MHRLMTLVFSLATIHRHPDPQLVQPKPVKLDARPVRLEAFFDRYQCPQPHYTHDYLTAADAYDLDYRLLPAISVRESTCGENSRRNNHWGWDSARRGFQSVPEGISFVSRQLMEGREYRSKVLWAKLLAYNPRPEYVVEIKRLMREIE